MRKFNIAGACEPSEDFMVDISGKLKEIAELVSSRQYFVINLPRQYGKTTTLYCLEQILKDEYIVASISFEGLGNKGFETEEKFCLRFMEFVRNSLLLANISDEYKEAWVNKDVSDLTELGYHITKMCKDQKIVLMIDEVDKTRNNRVFLDFLSILRSKYLARKNGKDYTFHSVILAGVYDIRNIKLKLIQVGLYSPITTEDKLYNSPWNITAKFNIDMSFNPKEIESMLKEYENDTHLHIDTGLISQEIYKYTSGYPFLVSNI